MRSLILLGEAVLIRRVIFVRHRLPSPIDHGVGFKFCHLALSVN